MIIIIIPERTVSESELNADPSSQEPIINKNITLYNFTATCDGSGIQESGFGENKTETGDTEVNREVDEMILSCEGVNNIMLENDVTVGTETGSTEVNREVDIDKMEEHTSNEGVTMLENDVTVGTETEKSTTCTHNVRMQENESY